MSKLIYAEEDFDTYYVLKVTKENKEGYYFSPRILVQDIEMAKEFNTLRSVRRIIKLYGLTNFETIKRKRNFS